MAYRDFVRHFALRRSAAEIQALWELQQSLQVRS